MATVQLGRFVRQLRGALARQDLTGLTDAELWQGYLRERNDAAFETLVRRHAPMVMGVCRRVLWNEQDAEDAFQATFLVLVRRGALQRSPMTLANWLHGVAYRTALEARRAAAKRRAKEAMVIPRMVMANDAHAELWPVLDEELGRLPERFRAAIVLCDLEGRTRKEVARMLGWAEGTVASRLARGRNILAERLTRRGFAGALAAGAFAEGVSSAHVPLQLVNSMATTFGAAANSPSTIKVIALTEGVLRSMQLGKIKNAIAACLVIGVTALGVGGVITGNVAGAMPGAQEQARPNPDEFRDRVHELKQQLRQLQEKIGRLEQEGQPKRDERDVANLFKHRVAFETGYTESNEGGRIEIREVWGTRTKIEVGGQYLVRGKYVLPRGERGKLYLYQTAAWTQPTSTLDLQMAEVDKPEGEFTLVHGMSGPGYFHVYLAHPDRYSRTFANVYFGTGDNVLRKKTW
jgi:RNA polymerase sigma factor (sigma-70 family)